MIRYVVDASCVGPLIIPDESENLMLAVRSALERSECVVPPHWRYEVGNLSLVAVRRGRATEDLILANLRDFSRFTVETDVLSADYAWSRCFDLAGRYRLTLYDAAYLELAERKNLTLLSMDRALIDTATAAGIAVNEPT